MIESFITWVLGIIPWGDEMGWNTVVEFLGSQTFFFWQLITFGIGTYIFWTEMKRIGKLRNDIFDQWLFTMAITVGWGRIAYVITRWSSFVNSYWFYLPYEKYAGDIYWFRAMPWKLLTVWDGGVLFTSLLSAFVIGILVHMLVFKKWRVRAMLTPVVVTMFFMAGSMLFIYGALLDIPEIYEGGGWMVVIVLVYQLLLNLLKKTFSGHSFMSRDFLSIIVLVLNTIIAWRTFFSQQLTSMDKVNLYAYVGTIAVFIILALVNYNGSRTMSSPVDEGALVRSSFGPERNRAIKPRVLND